jgi:hypothetical protein
MITQEIKSHINKIDFDLKSLFENVYIKEKTAGNQFYFEISANNLFTESVGSQRREAIVRINKKDLLSPVVKWSYSTNPLNEGADWIERTSSLERIAYDVYDVLNTKKMDGAYFESLEIHLDMINESNETLIEKSVVDNIQGILEKYGVKTLEIKSDIKPIYEGFVVSGTEKTFIIPHSSDIKMSDMFKIESEMKSLPGVNWVLFKEGFLEINVTYEN